MGTGSCGGTGRCAGGASLGAPEPLRGGSVSSSSSEDEARLISPREMDHLAESSRGVVSSWASPSPPRANLGGASGGGAARAVGGGLASGGGSRHAVGAGGQGGGCSGGQGGGQGGGYGGGYGFGSAEGAACLASLAAVDDALGGGGGQWGAAGYSKEAMRHATLGEDAQVGWRRLDRWEGRGASTRWSRTGFPCRRANPPRRVSQACAVPRAPFYTPHTDRIQAARLRLPPIPTPIPSRPRFCSPLATWLLTNGTGAAVPTASTRPPPTRASAGRTPMSPAISATATPRAAARQAWLQEAQGWRAALDARRSMRVFEPKGGGNDRDTGTSTWAQAQIGCTRPASSGAVLPYLVLALLVDFFSAAAN